MAYDEDLADRIRELIAAERGVEEKRMFGGLAFLINGNMSVAASGHGGLMVRVPPAETEKLLARDHVEPMVMAGRETRGWLRVSIEGLKTKRQLQSWVSRGAGYAKSLPPQIMIRIGTSGWSYDHWADVLYRPGLPVGKRLARYVEEFDSVELNASFYRWPKDATFAGWRKRLPDGFTMAVKAHRGLTHYRRLASPEPWVERFERCWTALGDRREALLVQLHPAMERDDARLDHFLSVMPDWIPLAMELRHPSWDDPVVYAMLERHQAAYVVMSGPGLRCIPRATSDLVYIRLHGPPEDSMYAGSYPDDELRQWADRISVWHAEGRRVLVYFNNDLGGHAIRNARTLKELLSARVG